MECDQAMDRMWHWSGLLLLRVAYNGLEHKSELSGCRVVSSGRGRQAEPYRLPGRWADSPARFMALPLRLPNPGTGLWGDLFLLGSWLAPPKGLITAVWVTAPPPGGSCPTA